MHVTGSVVAALGLKLRPYARLS